MALSKPNIPTASKLLSLLRSSQSHRHGVASLCTTTDPVRNSNNDDLVKPSSDARVDSVWKKVQAAFAELERLLDDPNLANKIMESDVMRMNKAFTHLYWQPFQETGYWLNYEQTEDESNCYLRIDIPGIGKEGLKLWMEKNELNLKGEETEADLEFTHKNNSTRTYACTIQFDADSYDTQKIKANLRNGILRIVIPKKQ